MLLLWPLFSLWTATIYLAQFLWSLGSSGFPAVQQARLVAVAPMLAAATIALNSSVTYLWYGGRCEHRRNRVAAGCRHGSCHGSDSYSSSGR